MYRYATSIFFTLAFSSNLTACGERRAFLAWPTLPPEAKSVLFVDAAADPFRVIARAPEDDSKIEITSDALFALAFSDTLEALGLEAGEVPLRGDCRLSFPLLVLAADLENKIWNAISLPAEVKAGLEAGGTCFGCVQYSTSQTRITTEPFRAGIGVALTSGVLVGSERRLLLVRKDGAHVIAGCEGPYSEGVRLPSGRFMLGGDNGQIAKVAIDEASLSCTVETATAPVANPTVVDRVIHLASATDRDEAFFSNCKGELFRTDGTSVEYLMTIDPHTDFIGTCTADGDILVEDSGVIFSAGSAEIGRWPEKTVRKLPLPRSQPPENSADRIVSLARTESSGLLAGVTRGEIYQLTDAFEGRPYLYAGVRDDVTAMIPRGRGMIVIIEGGRIVQINEGNESCDEQLIEIGGADGEQGHRAGWLGPSFFIANMAYSTNQGAHLVWLDPK